MDLKRIANVISILFVWVVLQINLFVANNAMWSRKKHAKLQFHQKDASRNWIIALKFKQNKKSLIKFYCFCRWTNKNENIFHYFRAERNFFIHWTGNSSYFFVCDKIKCDFCKKRFHFLGEEKKTLHVVIVIE